jgi:HK97 family phage portal protein
MGWFRRKPKAEERAAGDFGTAHVIERWSQVSMSDSGVVVTPDKALEVTAIAGAVQLIATTCATLPIDVYNDAVSPPAKVETAWQDALLDQPDTRRSGFDWWSDLFSHVEVFGNAFAVKVRSGREVVELLLLDPSTVQVSAAGRELRYVALGADGRRVAVPAEAMLHVRGWSPRGSALGESPLSRHIRVVGRDLARDEFEARFLKNSARPDVVLQFPRELTRDQAQEFLTLWNDNHQGVSNVGKAAAAGGGSTVTTIPAALKDAQFNEGAIRSVEDVARMFGIPKRFLGLDDATSTVEEDSRRLLRFCLLPRLKRAEAALKADVDLFGGYGWCPKFDTSELQRADAATEAEVLHKLVQVGMLLPDEARARIGLGPLPNGQGQIVQVTPVGGAPNDTPTPEPVEDDGDEEQEGRVRRGDVEVRRAEVAVMRGLMDLSERIEARVGDAQPPVVNVTVPAPVVNVTVPEQPAPVVHVAAAEVVLPAPIVNVPEIVVPAPIVNVAPAKVTVSVPAPPAHKSVKVRRDGMGNIVELDVRDD